LQQEFSKTPRWIGDISVNHGIHLTNNFSFGATGEVLSASPTRDASQVANASALSATVTIPCRAVAGNVVERSTISCFELLRAFPEFSSVRNRHEQPAGKLLPPGEPTPFAALSQIPLSLLSYSRLMEANSYLNSGE